MVTLGRLKYLQSPQVADEEARQWRAFNLMYGVLRLRGLPVADVCHPLWNDFMRAVKSANLLGTLLKCTHCTNYGHGPWLAGKRFLTIQMAATRLCRLADEDHSYWENLSERVFWDRGYPSGSEKLTHLDVLASRAISKRLPYEPCLISYQKNNSEHFFLPILGLTTFLEMDITHGHHPLCG